MPFLGKNYIINYYGTVIYNLNETIASEDVEQKYINASGEFPEELMFTIQKRTSYVYTHYDQKIYGDLGVKKDAEDFDYGIRNYEKITTSQVGVYDANNVP